jgi:3-hydroxyisobutyrate dehydrogenase-like beta-hydroxyacid dehydrogenase
VIGFNRTRARASLLLNDGLQVASSPAEATSRARCALLFVSDDNALRDVAEGPQGFLSALQRDAIVVNAGTHGRAAIERLAALVEARAASYLDAPVTGSKLGAENGELLMMIGGASAVLDRVRSTLAPISKRIVHVGEQVGSGQSAKYCLNLAQAVMLEGLLEAYGLALRLGVPWDSITDIVANSAASSGLSRFKTPFLAEADYTPHFRLSLMQKDLHLALEEAAAKRVALPAARTVVSLYDQAAAEGFGDEDFLATAKLQQRWLGVIWKQRHG